MPSNTFSNAPRFSGLLSSNKQANDTIDLNYQTISNNYTFPSTYNGMSAGPITINTGATITIPTGSFWVIV